MSLVMGKGLRPIVQGITGRAGRYHTQLSQDYVPCFVGGVSPGKGGSRCCGLPVFDTVFKESRWVIPELASLFSTAQSDTRQKITFLFGRLNYLPRTSFSQLNESIQDFANWARDFTIPSFFRENSSKS